MRAIFTCLAAAMLLLTAGCHVDDEVTALAASKPAITSSEQPLELAEVTVTCGFSVVADLKLGNDLVCEGNGLIINADGITIDLNGHSLTGSGSGEGIALRVRQNVAIIGGTIRGFTTGLLVANSSGVLVKGIRLTENREGIFLNGSSDNVVKENEAWQNQLRGIMVRPSTTRVSTRNLIKENLIRENPSGILVFGQPGNTFKENWISESSFAAIDLTGGGASGNLFQENVLEKSEAGISFGPGWTGNDFVENRLVQNTCGMSGPTAGNAFKENLLLGNASDFC
jgi:parallel beta-helix repeat protein